MARAHIVGIGGTGTGALAGLLQAAGWQVQGSDGPLYPPMSLELERLKIPLFTGYDPAHLRPRPGQAPLDLVVVGNVIRADNPEAQAALASGVRVLSMPQAMAEFGIGDKHSIVVAGTHGKTTVTALIAHCLVHAGLDPGFFVGGVMQDGSRSVRAGRGPCFVIEGDEYDTAFFDKGPKFLHYRARTAILTSLEFDHADIFADIGAVEAAFAALVRGLPADGQLWVHDEAERAGRLAAACPAPVGRFGRGAGGEVQVGVGAWSSEPAGLRFVPRLGGQELGPMRVPLWGQMALANSLAAVAALVPRWLSPAAMAAGLASFPGVRRRLELVGEFGGVAVVDDFAHHPTAVARTLEAARCRWPGRRLWAAYEPRSATARRNLFHHAYLRALAGADRVVIGHHARLAEVPEAERFSPAALAADLAAAGTPASAPPDLGRLEAELLAEARPGDVVLVLSNGDFGGLIGRLGEGLAARAGAAGR